MHIRHAAKALVANERSELKLVRVVQLCHVRNNLLAVGNGVLNELSPLDCHALSKFTLFALVPSFASAGNDVRAEQFCHADVKLEQFLMSVVLKSLSELSPHQA